MADVPVTRVIDWDSVVAQARKGPEPPVPVYEFNNGRKRFLDIYNPSSIWDKPSDHSPDPDLV